MRPIDLTGQRFGRLLVIRTTKERDHRNASRSSYECLCDCGQTKRVGLAALTRGHTTSCGCRRRLAPGEANFNVLFRIYQKTALRRGLSFELSEDQARTIFASNCFYCGVRPTLIKNTRGSFGSFIYNGIDRLDNSIGYIQRM